MSGKPTLYELFDETSLQYWGRLTASGVQPNREQLAALIAANIEEPLPAWLNPLILKGLRGELKGKPGRPKKGALDRYRLELAAVEYKRLLQEPPGPKQTDATGSARRTITKQEARKQDARKQAAGKQGASGRALEPRHERAAKIAIKTWGLRMNWTSFLNEISSKK